MLFPRKNVKAGLLNGQILTFHWALRNGSQEIKIRVNNLSNNISLVEERCEAATGLIRTTEDSAAMLATTTEHRQKRINADNIGSFFI